MSGWTQYREQCHRRRNAFLLLMLSGAIRPAHAELPQFRVSGSNGQEGEATSAPNSLLQPEQSRWFRNITECLCKHTRRPLPMLSKYGVKWIGAREEKEVRGPNE